MTYGGNSLTLGDETTSGSICFKGDNRYVNFPNLRLVKGSFSQASNGWIGYAGTAEVLSTADAPFVIGGKSEKDKYFYMKLKGDESSVIKISTGGQQPFVPYADQSATYAGSWILAANTYFRPQKTPSAVYPGATCQNNTSAQVFGMPLAKFNPRALVACAGVSIRYEAGYYAFSASDNRGLTLDAKDATVSYIMVNGNTHKFGWPIAGEGTLALVNNGTFMLQSRCDVNLAASSSSTKIVLCSGAEITETGGLTVLNGGVISMNAATDRVTVNNPHLKAPTFSFATTSDGSDVSQLRLAGEMDITGKIALAMSQIPFVTSATNVTVLVFDAGVSRTFTPNDFVSLVPNGTEIMVARDAMTQDQVVSLHLEPIVKSMYQTSMVSINNNWSDGVVPHAGARYVVISGHALRSSEAEGEAVTFAGDALALPGGILTKNTRFTIHNLYGLGGGVFSCGGYHGKGGVFQSLAGELDVRATDTSSFGLNIGRSAFVLESTTTGSGRIQVQSSDESNQARSFEVTGDVSGYRGCWNFNNATNVVNNTFALKVHGEDDFGTPDAFAANALMLGYGCVVTPQADVMIDDATRGVTFAAAKPGPNNPAVGVGFNLLHDFTVKTPVVIQAGKFTLNGTGTLAYGLGGVTLASGATFIVNGGTLKPQHRDALKGAAVTLAAGTSLAFDAPLAADDSRAAGGLDLTTTTVTPVGGGCSVRIDFDKTGVEGVVCKVPLATFASAAVAESMVAAIKVQRIPSRNVKLSVEDATVYAEIEPKGFTFSLK